MTSNDTRSRRTDPDPADQQSHPGCGHFDSSRVHLTWSDNPKPTVPDVISVGPIQRRMREPTPWISIRDASRLIGSSDSLVHRGIRTGQIKQRKVNRMYPSLDRESVMAYIRDQAAERRKYDTPAWISRSNAFRLLGNAQLIRRGITTGQITQRHVGHNYPSLERTSVMAYIREHDAELPPNEPGAWISRHQAYQLTGTNSYRSLHAEPSWSCLACPMAFGRSNLTTNGCRLSARPVV